MKNIAITISVCAILVGCGAGAYQSPKVDAPTSTKNGVLYLELDVNLSQTAWWSKFNDKNLDKLVSAALENNNQILAAKANILEAEAKLQSAKYAWLPSLSASGFGIASSSVGASVSPKSATGKALSSAISSSSSLNAYGGAFIPQYSANIVANLSEEEFANASLNAKKASLGAVRLSVISQTISSYFMLLSQKNKLVLQQELISDFKKLLALETAKAQIGKGDALTLALLEREISENSAIIPAIENAISQSENAIAILIGKNPAKLAFEVNIMTIDAKDVIAPNIPSSALKNRPDIIMAEENLKMAHANTALANSIFFPTISLTGYLGGASLALSNLFGVGLGFWAVQAAASMPMLNASSFENIKAAKEGEYAAYYEYMQTLKSAFGDVDNSLTNYQKSVVAYEQTLKAQEFAKKEHNIALMRYGAGMKDYRYTLNQKIDFDKARLSLNDAKADKLSAITLAYSAMAGGCDVK